MKRKISIYITAVVIIAVLSTAVIISGVFNGIIRRQIWEDLKIDSETILMTDDSINESKVIELNCLRVTVLNDKNFIVFDSLGETGNYINGSDINEAQMNGEGFSIESSDSIDKDIYYYSEKLDNGNILRVSRKADNILRFFEYLIPALCGIIIIMAALCFIVTRVLTKKIIKPIEKMADDISFKEVPEYEELVPVVNMLKEQHENILNNARVRQEFSANVSHELKTPLTVISGYAELIENKMVDENSVVRFAGEIHHHSDRLLSLINDIIKLSELDSDSIEAIYEDINLSDVVDDCMRILQENARRHDINLYEHCDSKAVINGNRSMLEELVTNLVNNAITYNKQGGSVWIDVNKDNGSVVLTVKDNGIGIPQEHRERIFERFYRVDKSRSKISGGTGLGLAIVKHIAASHNAKITLKSEVGEGTEIKVIF